MPLHMPMPRLGTAMATNIELRLIDLVLIRVDIIDNHSDLIARTDSVAFVRHCHD